MNVGELFYSRPAVYCVKMVVMMPETLSTNLQYLEGFDHRCQTCAMKTGGKCVKRSRSCKEEKQRREARERREDKIEESRGE